MPSIDALLTQSQLSRSGHLVRMQDSRLPKQLFYGELTGGHRQRGRPKLRYKDTLKKSLQKCDIGEKRWEFLATNRHHPDFLYIGSTVNLRHRWANPKSDCKLRKGHKCHVAQHFLDKQHPVDPQFTCLRIFAIEAVHKKENLALHLIFLLQQRYSFE
ncbi:hypothetical protein ACOMHN_003422 [Nucella lapillus]